MANTFHTPSWLIRDGIVAYFERTGFPKAAEKARTLDDEQIDRLNTALCKAIVETDRQECEL